MLSPKHQSAWMSKITNDGLTQSGAGCFIDVPIWQQWASNSKGDCTTDAAQVRQSYKICLFADTVCIMVHSNFRKDSSTTKVAIIMKQITINAVIKPVNSR